MTLNTVVIINFDVDTSYGFCFIFTKILTIFSTKSGGVGGLREVGPLTGGRKV